jgi:uncharacterized membrane protein
VIEGLPRLLFFFTVVGSALMAGVFFAFSTFVMKALERLPPPQGIAAMQSINVVVINPAFMSAFLGTAAACVILGIISVLRWHTPGAGYLLSGSLLYFLGTFAVTLVFNVPLNNSLAAVDPASADGNRVWARYVRRWTFWNHVRTVAAIAATAFLMMALRSA